MKTGVKKLLSVLSFSVAIAMLSSCTTSSPAGEKKITRIWLSYNATQPQNIVVNWFTPVAGDSEVELVYGDSTHIYAGVSRQDTLHHVEVPLSWKDASYRYRVRSGDYTSDWYSFRGITPTEAVRIVFIADWGFAVHADMSVVLSEDPNLIVTGGDNIQGLFIYGKKGDPEEIESYLRLVDSFPDLFRSVPFMPAPGNHDKQLYPRGKKPPVGYDLYDTNAVAFRNFFELPGKEWRWTLDVPATNLRIVALDLQHLSDMGTTWQTCHSYGPGSDQYQWYKKQMECNPCKNIITISNGKNGTVRTMAGGIWKPLTQKSDVVITGSGYYAEYAIVDGTPYLNSSLIAGDLWSDPVAEYSKSEASYVLITADRDKANVQLKRLKDRSVIYGIELESKN